jgi:hypothetical protein
MQRVVLCVGNLLDWGALRSQRTTIPTEYELLTRGCLTWPVDPHGELPTTEHRQWLSCRVVAHVNGQME